MSENKNVRVEMKDVQAMGWNEVRRMAKSMGLSAGGSREEVEARIQRYTASATVETAVAVENKKEESSVKSNNEKMLDRWAEKTQDVVISHNQNARKEKENSVLQKAMDIKNEFLANREYYDVLVKDAKFFQRPKGKRIGYVEVQIPEDYMEVKIWNDGTREFEQHEFTDYDVSAFRKGVTKGDGTLTCAIIEGFDGKPTVMLPSSYSKKHDQWFDMVATRNKRVPVEKREAYTFNNKNLEAALTAVVQTLTNEFVKANPENRHGFNESCFTCQHFVWLGMKDGVDDDIISQDKESTVVMNPLTVDELTENGPFLPQAVCGANGKFVDYQAVQEMNAAVSLERDFIRDEEGRLRYQSGNQLRIGGKLVYPSEYRRESTNQICAGCAHYTKLEKKSDTKIAQELLHADGYVSKYYAGAARPDRQVVETLTEKGWKKGFPGQFSNPEDIRVRGLGGIMVYVSDEVLAYVDPEFTPETEAFDKELASIESKISQMFHVARYMRELPADQVGAVIEMANNKPEGLSDRHSSRWDKAVEALGNALLWAEEARKAKEYPPFAQKFFVEFRQEAVKIDIEEVMNKMLERRTRSNFESMEDLKKSTDVNRNDSIHGVYDDLSDSEIARRLDDDAMDLIYEAIETGQEFVIVGGKEEDRKHAVRGLQYLLQSTLTLDFYSLAQGIRRDADPKEALNKLKASDEVKSYLQAVLNI